MRVSLLAVVCAGLALVAASGAGAQQGRYLFDILKQPAYRAAWTKMIGRPARR